MIVITPPATEPVTLAEMKAQIGIPTGNTASDTIITRRITEARQWCENFTDRAFITQTREIRFDKFQDEFRLPSASAVVSLKYVDINGTVITLTATDYVLDTYDRIPFVRLAYGSVWPPIRDERNAVRIQYTAGYGAAAAVDPLIKEAVMLLVGHWMNFQPQSENGMIMSHVPKPIERLLNDFVIEHYQL